MQFSALPTVNYFQKLRHCSYINAMLFFANVFCSIIIFYAYVSQ